MIARTEVKFSEEQIIKAEHRLAYQRSIVGRLKSGSASGHMILLAEDLLYLMKDRVVFLHERHAALLAEQAVQRTTPSSESHDFFGSCFCRAGRAALSKDFEDASLTHNALTRDGTIEHATNC